MTTIVLTIFTRTDADLSHFDRDPLLADLEFSDEIPTMDCFKETPSAC